MIVPIMAKLCFNNVPIELIDTVVELVETGINDIIREDDAGVGKGVVDLHNVFPAVDVVVGDFEDWIRYYGTFAGTCVIEEL